MHFVPVSYTHLDVYKRQVSDYKLLHGEALSIGMAEQALMSARLGYMSEEQAERVIKLYERAGLPTRIPCLLYTSRCV